MTRVAVSVLNYNSAQSTIECIKSLLVAEKAADGKCHLDIYISDNASGGEDQHHLQISLEEMATVHLQINQKNLGFSAGHNRNLERIFAASRHDYVWLLNNDCLVAETALGALVECAQQNPQVGILGATLLEADGKTIQCAGGCFYNAWVSSYRQYGQGKPLAHLEQLKQVKYDYIAGASLFFPINVLQTELLPLQDLYDDGSDGRKQWLNESFFLYFEELDLAKRLNPGLSISWCKKALITHTGGVSSGTGNASRTALAEYHSTLSALKFTGLYYPRRLWIIAVARFSLKCLLLLLRGDFKLIKSLSMAYMDFLRKRKKLSFR